ncbi:DEAD/DEAH box helicase [Streptomyces sp. NPDC057909]|uniref:DEAD/DEAH box helicase n=1 Tax=Streptomyces sp. NPDC057909 TaxID=3346277 RepID=UPI0036E99DC4
MHDEVHGLGSAGTAQRLAGFSDPIRYRLGLSATPDREYDDAGNAFIEAHIGPVLMEFGLDKAIRRGILAPFNYYPLPYDLTGDDRKRLRDVHAKKAARALAGNPMSDKDVAIELARVYKTSQSKLPEFDRFVAANPELLERCVVFTETQEYGQQVLDLIHKYRPDFHSYFTNEQSSTLDRFAQGDLQCLVTCHRLSEGIDIRSLNTVVLFSSARAHLETIQRIGRCLRTDPANPEKVANIVDFVRTASGNGTPNSDVERQTWLTDLSHIRYRENGR